MPGYTIEGLDNLLEILLEKINNIISQMERIDQSSSEEYYILGENFDRYMEDYVNLLDQRMNLYARIRDRNNAGQN